MPNLQRSVCVVVKKTGLGKGLESLMGGADAEAGLQQQTTELPITQIVINKDQPRKNFDEIELSELSDSIKQNGILQPILVRKKGTKYEIVAGERRYQAAKLAGLKEVPVCIKEIDDKDVFRLALIENLQRADLNPVEEAQGYEKLIKENDLTQDDLSQLLSKSRSAITNTLRLLTLPQEIQDMMIEGKLTAGHARAILAVAGDEGRLKLANKVIEEHLTVRQTENLAPLFSGSEEQKIAKARVATPQSFKRAARRLRLALDTNVRVKTVRNKNKIEIEFADEDELLHLVELLCEQVEL